MRFTSMSGPKSRDHLLVTLNFSAGFRRDHGLYFSSLKPVDCPLISVISLVCQQDVSLNFADQNIRAVQIAGLSGRQMKAHRIAQSITQSLDFGAQPAF